jgi:hypothetical protein
MRSGAWAGRHDGSAPITSLSCPSEALWFAGLAVRVHSQPFADPPLQWWALIVAPSPAPAQPYCLLRNDAAAPVLYLPCGACPIASGDAWAVCHHAKHGWPVAFILDVVADAALRVCIVAGDA